MTMYWTTIGYNWSLMTADFGDIMRPNTHPPPPPTLIAEDGAVLSHPGRWGTAGYFDKQGVQENPCNLWNE